MTGFEHLLVIPHYAVATTLPLSLPTLYAFIGGRGAQEKTIAELKGEFALDVVPTRHYSDLRISPGWLG